MLEQLKDVTLDFDLYVGANVQEEVGLRGAEVAARLVDPDVAFVVDCSPANDMKGRQGLSGVLGEGALLRIKDGTMLLKPAFKTFYKMLRYVMMLCINITFHPAVLMVVQFIKRISVSLQLLSVYVHAIFTVRMPYLIFEIIKLQKRG